MELKRRARTLDAGTDLKAEAASIDAAVIESLEAFDRIYRTLCAVMYNYVPTSGHPGGSISSGRFVAGLLFGSMDYDVSNPERPDADIISYAAGHKALGLYALWALRNEIVRIAAPEMLPPDIRNQLRLEDLLGFRRNPVQATPLFVKHRSRPLDGHPTPATPFVRLSTGASGVGVASSIGLALGALDTYGSGAPRVHIVEGDGGLTPGRVGEALAAAGTSSLGNAILHVDWNQASIDSNRVCADETGPGDYVQWNPMELAYLHDWNVVHVPDGTDLRQILAAQRAAVRFDNGQPVAVVYRTTKGWRYGIEGKASHGAGHTLCSDGFHAAVAPLLEGTDESLPTCEANVQRCQGGEREAVLEECFWEALMVVRRFLERDRPLTDRLAGRLREARERLIGLGRRPREGCPRIDAIRETTTRGAAKTPADLVLKPGIRTTLRAELGRTLNHLNRISDGAILAASADLLASTSVNLAAKGFPEGFFNARTNPEARLLSLGGICEDAMAGILSGLSSFGRHIGAGSSYGAFMAALGHVPARLHAIGNVARREATGEPCRPFFLICAHAGLKTGEDGPTHADPQALQLLQENFPPGAMVTLTPWDPQEIWTLVGAALARRPAVIAPFVTRPPERVIDRAAAGLAPASEASSGFYRLRAAKGRGDGTIVLQGSGVAYAFVEETLPRLVRDGIDLNVYYVASAELFDALPAEERQRIFPEERAIEAIGITGFTLPTMYRWVRSERGRAMTLHPFRTGRYPGSGQASKVLAEAGLDGEGQYRSIVRWVEKASPAA